MVTAPDVAGLPLVEVLTRAQRRLARDLSARLAEDGATLEQYRVLRALADPDVRDGADGRSMGELAESLEVPHPTLTRVVDGLVDAALVYRQQSDVDRRRVSVHLSRMGAQRLDRLTALVAAHEEAVRASEDWASLHEQLVELLNPRG
jgi:DNA-binding MarR family transcriptional regulator